MKKLLFTLFLVIFVTGVHAQKQNFNFTGYSGAINPVSVIGTINKTVTFPKGVNEVSVTVDISTLFPNNYYITSCLCPIAGSTVFPYSRSITFTFLRSHALLESLEMEQEGPVPGEIYFAPISGTTDKKVILLRFNLEFIDY
jgi:hypothetical protein